MPDVFDQIGGGMSVAAAPKGDVFDQLPVQNVGTSAQVPTGDHAESTYFKSHPGMDPLAVHGAFMQLRGQAQIPQPGTAQEFSQQVADQQGGLTHFGNALGQTLANPIQGAVGLVAPQMGMRRREENALQYGPQTGAGGFLGAQAGNLVNAPLAMSGVGRVLSAAEAMGNKRIDVAQERAAGQDVSGASELARVAGTGALDLGVNTLANKIGGKAFAGIGKAVGAEAAPAAGQVLKTLAKRFGVDLAANEAIAHGQIAAQNLIDSRPVTEGMGKESLVSPVVQTAAFAVGHGGSDMLKSMRERSAAKAAVQPTGQENARPNEGQQGLVKPEGAVEVGRETHTADDRQAAAPTQSDSVIDGRLEGGRTPKAQEEPAQSQHNDARPYNGDPNNDGHATSDRQNPGQTSGENRVMDVFDRVADAEPQITPTPGEKNVLDAHMRSVDREIENGPQDNSMKMRQPERARDQHPERLGGGKDMTDYVARISDDAATAPLIGSMTEPHGNFVRARVPIDQLHGLGDTGADVVASKGGEQKNPAVSIPSGTGEEGHLDLIDGNHSVEGLRQAGATHAESYVPESMIGKHGIEAVGAQKPAVPQPIVEQKTPLKQMMARRQGSARPGFVAVPDSKYVERDVKPALAKATDAVKKSLDTVNRTLGTGASWSVKDRDTANHVSQALAEHDRALAQAEHELKPHREAMETWTPDAKAQWIDAVEGSGISPDPKHQDAADFNLKYNQENIDRGKLVGINTKGWSGDYIGRLAEFPDEHEGSGGTGRTTLAGPQNFLKGRVFGTFSEFKKFVEAHDGKLKYSNPMDMLLAKQGEIQKSIAAREAMYKEDNHGQLKWVPDGEKPPEGFEKGKLADPLANQERRQILPSSTVARLAGMSHFDAQNFLKGPQVDQQAQYLRPGTDVPAGYSYSGEKVTGTYHGNENVAGIFNNLVSPGLKKNVPVLHQIAAGVKGATSLSLNLSGAHYMIESLNNAGQSIGRAIRAATEGDAQGVRDNLKMVNPLAANKLGKQAREQYADPGAHPQLESKVQTAVEGGAPFSRSSVLDKNYLADAKTEWAAGNRIGAGVRVAKHLYDNIPIHHYLFKEFVPNLKAAAAVMTAGQAEAKGLTGEAKQRFMALAHDDIENNLGMVARNRQFQNRVISDAMDIALMAPKYVEGRIRNTAAAGRDSLQALRDVSSGKRPVLTPAMATAAGHMVAHAMIATLTQIAYTTATTGKPILPSGPMDLLKPRTGRKDDQGREERLTMPTPISTIFGLLSRGTGALTSRIAPVWHTIANEMANVDEHNVEIRHRGDSLGKQLVDSAKYAAKGQAPFAIQNMMEGSKPGQPHGLAKNAGEAMGVHTSYSASSSAEQEARSALFERGRANPMTQDQYARQQERGRVLEEMKNKNPDASKDLAADLRSGKLTNSDRIALARQRKEPEGLTGELKKMQAQEIMDRVWPKMTADEKQKNQWIVRGMIGRSQTLTPPQKQELWGRIKQEMKGVK